MNRRSFVMRGMAALVVVPGVVRAQSLVICRQCGREAKLGETVCSHCGAALSKPSAAAAVVAEAPKTDAAAEVARLATAAVKDSLRQARELEEKQPEVALCYYQNALALMRLVPSEVRHASAEAAILEGNEHAMQALLRGRVPCRKCNGTGKYQVDVGKINHVKNIKAVEGIACPACKGVGGAIGYRDVAKVKMAILQGRREFERRQMVTGDVRVGQALVPASLDAVLTNRQRTLVMTGIPVPCSSCQLTGRQKCVTCQGSGWVKCDYTGCEHGEIKATKKTSARSSKRLNEEETAKCPQCDGLGEMPCKTCKGVGNIACKTCDGSGVAPRCTRCSGTGLATCSKCRGSGQVKGAPCPECKGETVILCTTCRGEGAVAR